ncbi:MAG: spermidine synthase [Puniceicoccaceae bacterium]
MAILYRGLDYVPTPLGDLMLRWRQSPQLPGIDIYEVKLGEHFLMSSLFHEAETQLAELSLSKVSESLGKLDVVVGGLGLGYTAAAALESGRVDRLVVIEMLEPVIAWHQRAWVPLGEQLCGDPRCNLRQADFFACVLDPNVEWFPGEPSRRVHAVLLDIDHSPRHWLHPCNASFYSEQGLTAMRKHILPGGVFGLWADGETDEAFTARLGAVFQTVEAHCIEFENPVTGGISRGSVYVAGC